jgi:hypothetical protein
MFFQVMNAVDILKTKGLIDGWSCYHSLFYVFWIMGCSPSGENETQLNPRSNF